MNLVRLMVAGALTFTANVQVSTRCFESVARHVTGVDPTEKRVPLAGVQAIATGGVPPVAVGVPYATMREAPLGEFVTTSDGQLSFGGSSAGTTGVGAVVVFEQEPAAHATSIAKAAALSVLKSLYY